MATLLEDLTDIEEKAQGLVENKVANFAYTQEAYDNDDVAGVSEYDINKAQNIPIAEAEILDVNTTVLNKGYRSQASSITRMLMNHFLGRTSYNLNKSVDLFKKGFLGIKNALGKPNGLATLDSTGRIPDSQLPELAIEDISKLKLKDIFSHLLGRFWTQSNTTSGNFSFATYANGIWVAGGTDGLYYSQDGITWTQSIIDRGYFNFVTYANDIWVTSNNKSGSVYYSQDGIAWTQSNLTTSGSINFATYANGIWVTGSYNKNSGLYYSQDGITWTQSNTTSGNFRFATYANGIWVVGDYEGLYYSQDGISWTQSNLTTSGNFRFATYANGIWVTGSNNTDSGLYYSQDGITWTQSNTTSGNFSFATYANGIWVTSTGQRDSVYYSDINILIKNGWLVLSE